MKDLAFAKTIEEAKSAFINLGFTKLKKEETYKTFLDNVANAPCQHPSLAEETKWPTDCHAEQ
ncbi:MAG: hypothetical protein KDN22_30585 [Verrucomicrobiae bacterium]|nr:hypothetical protein [Verrucomicrobiae bacterium]